ncbi:MAG: MBL fold metallo-hydrolase [Acidobacteriota bacterium]
MLYKYFNAAHSPRTHTNEHGAVFAATDVLTAEAQGTPRKRRGRFRSLSAIVLAVFLALCVNQAEGQAVGEVLPRWAPGTLDIHRISTGRGDAVLYIFPDGTAMLVDPGAETEGPRVTRQRPDASRSPGEWVVRYVQHVLPHPSESALDYALLTHFHADHMGGLVSSSPPSRSGQFKLSGITEVGEHIRIRKMLDRAWPDYNSPVPLTDPMVKNYQAFLAWQIRHNGMRVERFQPGRNDQIVMLHAPRDYPQFEVRNVAASGEIWTGVGTATRQHFPPVEEAPPKGRPTENDCSIVFRIRYGNFDYFAGGDLPGGEDDGAPSWHDVETPVAKVVGPVDVNVLNHHGSADAENEFFVRTLRPRVHVFSAWSTSHPDACVLRRLLSTRLYPGARDIFATNMSDANKLVVPELSKLKSDQGHIVIRVAEGGDTYRIMILDDSAETYRIIAVHGPYESR